MFCPTLTFCYSLLSHKNKVLMCLPIANLCVELTAQNHCEIHLIPSSNHWLQMLEPGFPLISLPTLCLLPLSSVEPLFIFKQAEALVNITSDPRLPRRQPGECVNWKHEHN